MDSRRPKPISAFRRQTARRLRENSTDAEQRLWRALRRLPVHGSHFRRQVPIGRYVADFACLAARLIIEVDGSQHASAHNIVRDDDRTRWFEAEGYKVLRFWNNDISNNIDTVLSAIHAALPAPDDAEPRLLVLQRHRWTTTADRATPPRLSTSSLADPPPPGEDGPVAPPNAPSPRRGC
jgi:very-short-patch-repair endonuclease